MPRSHESQSKPRQLEGSNINGCSRLFISLHGSEITIFVPGLIMSLMGFGCSTPQGRRERGSQAESLGLGSPPLGESVPKIRSVLPEFVPFQRSHNLRIPSRAICLGHYKLLLEVDVSASTGDSQVNHPPSRLQFSKACSFQQVSVLSASLCSTFGNGH